MILMIEATPPEGNDYLSNLNWNDYWVINRLGLDVLEMAQKVRDRVKNTIGPYPFYYVSADEVAEFIPEAVFWNLYHRGFFIVNEKALEYLEGYAELNASHLEHYVDDFFFPTNEEIDTVLEEIA